MSAQVGLGLAGIGASSRLDEALVVDIGPKQVGDEGVLRAPYGPLGRLRRHRPFHNYDLPIAGSARGRDRSDHNRLHVGRGVDGERDVEPEFMRLARGRLDSGAGGDSGDHGLRDSKLRQMLIKIRVRERAPGPLRHRIGNSQRQAGINRSV